MAETVLRTQGLAKRYGDIWALGGVDLEVKRGEVFGFLGPNGAGKTTFTKCVTGFVRPDQGTVEILGFDAVRDTVRASAHIGLVPDQYDFYPNLTGRQHLDFYGRLHGMANAERRQRIDDVLGLVRMHERADSRVKGYSHGMKQRICIAQALLHQPDLVFFDEPTNGLDPQGAYELREMIKGLSRDGTTVFLNSHVLTEVEQTCARVAIINKGKLRTVSAVGDLRRRHSGGSLVRVRLLAPTRKHVSALEAVVGKVEADGSLVTFSAGDAKTADAVAALVAAGARVASVEPVQASLEDVFLELTEGGSVS